LTAIPAGCFDSLAQIAALRAWERVDNDAALTA
jgi:hypothetical protein